MRRSVYSTPKSYLSFIASYKEMYTKKLADVKKLEGQVNLGLEKLIKGAADVEEMKGVLAKEQVKLEVATEDTNKMLGSLQISQAEANKEKELVEGINAKCKEDATRIGAEKEDCDAQLAVAMPHVTAAEKAIDSITPGDVQFVKKILTPPSIIRMVFDCLAILFHEPLADVSPDTLEFKSGKVKIPFIAMSFDVSGKQIMTNNDKPLLARLVAFGEIGKDIMNEETVEFLSPYIAVELFTPETAKSAAGAAEGMCIFASSMKSYYEAS